MAELPEQVVERYGEADQRQEQLRLLLRTSRAVIDELQLPALYRTILEQSRRLVAIDSASLAVVGPAGAVTQLLHLAEGSATSPAVAAAAPVGPETLEQLTRLVAALRPGEISALVLPVALDGASTPSHQRRTAVALPVHHRTTLVAVLLLAVSAEGGLSGDQEDLLTGLAVTAGIAVENARLYEDSRRRQEWLAKAAELTHQVLCCTTHTEALHLIAAAARLLADADLLTLWLPATPDRLQLAIAVSHEQAGLLDPTTSVTDAVDTAPSGGWHGACMRVADHPDAEVLALMPQSGIDSVLMMPLVGDDDVSAVIVAGRRSGRPPYADVDLDLAETFAHQMGLTLEVLAGRKMQARVAVLEDRERIAADLHDRVIQRLYAAGLRLRAVSTSLPDHVESDLDKVTTDLSGTLSELRSAIYQLTTNTDDDGGLRAAVLEVAEQVAPVLGFRAGVRFEGPVDTVASPELTKQAVAVIREATTNAGKHASATEVNVHVSASASHLTLLVVDNGTGLGPSRRRSGLQNLRRRAELLGGTLNLDTPVGGGTQLSWIVPLPVGTDSATR